MIPAETFRISRFSSNDYEGPGYNSILDELLFSYFNIYRIQCILPKRPALFWAQNEVWEFTNEIH